VFSSSATATASTSKAYDVVVIGGGHAGCEAAHASARSGASVLLVTHKLSTIGTCSCNPSIGGVGKGTLVKEVDALDGLMGRMADKSGINFKVLNQAKGPAVYGPRAQIDRELYRTSIHHEMSNTPNLEMREGSIEDITTDAATNELTGVVLADGQVISTRHAVITTGTFLGAVMHVGPDIQQSGGRVGDQASVGLSETLNKFGFAINRLTTATPPRIARDSMNTATLVHDHGDEVPVPFSFMNDAVDNEVVDMVQDCFITYTNAATHDIIRANLERVPTFIAKDGLGQGPRYCMSIEGKIRRFGDREKHLIWLEPEGVTSDQV
jgi:glucose-inhibited division protein A